MSEQNPNEMMGAAQDIAPLAWVIDEIRGSLTQAVAGIKTFVASKADLDSLRNARNQVHQANGALQLLDLRGVALVTEAIEQLLRRWEAEPKDCLPSAVRTVETAINALFAYLDGLLSGRPNQPIRLYPYYRDILTLNRAPRVHPADLIFPDLSRRPAFHTIEVRPLTADQLRVRRVLFEEGLLGFLRDADNQAARKKMRDALHDLEQLPQRGLARSFWWIVRGLLEALQERQVQVDVDLKRVLARLNLQLRRLIEGGSAVAERLMVDTLYYVGRADDKLPRVLEVKRLYGLDALIPPDFERATLTAVDADALRGLKDALAAAKTVWGHVVGGVAAETPKFAHEIGLALAAAQRLQATAIAQVLQAVAAAAAGRASETVGLEVASALLFVELGADDLPQGDPEFPQRAAAVIERLQLAARGAPLPDSAPWMSELARRAQDRLTMATVVAETQSTLREIEARLDRFFRNPAQRDELLGTVPLFDQVSGVLSVLGHEEPVEVLRGVQQSVKNFANPSVEARPEEFGRIAQNLGAIGFFVESLKEDAERPRSMFRYDPASGLFSAELGQGPAVETLPELADEFVPPPRAELPAAVPAMPPPAAARADLRTPAVAPENVESAAQQHAESALALAQRLAAAPLDNRALHAFGGLLPQLTADADLLDDAALKERVQQAGRLLKRFTDERNPDDARALTALFAPAPAAPVPELTAPLPSTQAAADRELQDIFVEEANEVLDGIGTQLATLRAQPDDQATLTTVRRAFHTLKGSSRMVGLKTFGEAAWGVEQCFNLWLAQEKPASDDLMALAASAAGLMRGWIGRIAQDPNVQLDVAPLVRAAQRVREGGPFELDSSAPSGAAQPPKSSGSAAPEAPSALPAVTGGAAADGFDAPAVGLIGSLEPQQVEFAPLAAFETVDFPLDAPTPTPAPAAAADDEELPDLAALPDFDEMPAVAVAEPAAPDAPDAPDADEAAPREDLRRIGPLEISHGLYSVFLTEADECIRILATDCAEWRFEPLRGVLPATLRRAHSLAGISGTVGLTPVWDIASPLDEVMHALRRADTDGAEPVLLPAEFDTLERVVQRMRGMLHQFAAGIYPDDAPEDVAAVHALREAVSARSTAELEAQAEAALELAPAAGLDAERGAGAANDEAAGAVAVEIEPLPAAADAAPPPDLSADAAPAFAVAEPSAAEMLAIDAADAAAAPAPAADLAPAGDAARADALAFAPGDTGLPAAADDPYGDGLGPIDIDLGVALPLPLVTEDGAAIDAPVATDERGTAPAAEPAAAPLPTPAVPAVAPVSSVRDELDADLLPVFLAEAGDLLPAVAANLRALQENPNDREVARGLMRQLHTVKGSARMAGAMRLGELVHDMETRVESAMQLTSVPGVIVDDLQAQYDQAMQLFDGLQNPDAAAAAPQPAPAAFDEGAAADDAPTPAAADEEPAAEPPPGAPVIAQVIDLAAVREQAAAPPPPAAPRPPVMAAPLSVMAPPLTATLAPKPSTPPQPASFIRVRSDVLDKLVDQAGEVSIARAKLENELGTLKGGLTDLTENIQRLRLQLREVEIQAEAQIQARGDKLDQQSEAFDPLEFDRFTRLQELTRLLAESVEDVAMVQNNMLKGLQLADTDLVSQSRLTRELQQQLMRVRLVPFSNVAERLYRVVRQTAKELDKRVALDIRGGSTEIDRGVLERMVGPFEHLVRNAIVHGLETPAERAAAGKGDTGELRFEVRQEGNEIIVVIADDGAGLNLERIRQRAVDKGLLAPDQPAADRELMELVFAPGFSTATEVTELAGRGVGMDVVRSELASFGGRIAVASETGRGTRFTLYLPLTLAVTQVVLATVGPRRYAIPAGMVEQVRRYKPALLMPALTAGELELPPIGLVVLRPLGQLLGEEIVVHQGRQMPVVLLRSGDDRLAVAVDDLSSNQEVVVKNVGPQVSRLAGILGATILGNGEIVLIINPVQLILRAPEPWQPVALPAVPTTAVEARRAQERAAAAPAASAESPTLVMVVDDSLTVRRVTQRLLERNGYDVVLAKDGVDALRQLQDVKPDVMLVDIEMPRMDGFDLTRNVRGAGETRAIPIIMITSRTAEKHRGLAFEVGVNEYLGKPYQEDELLRIIRQLTGRHVAA